MIRDEAFTWCLMAWAVVWVMVWLMGCAGPEPEAPIHAYRAEYGFTP